MKINRLATALIFTTILWSGCATPKQYFSALPKPEQKFIRAKKNRAIFGTQEIKSGIQNEVLFEPTANNMLFNGMAVFWIYAKNLDREPFRFGASALSVEDKNGSTVEVLTIDEVANRLRGNKSQRDWAFLIASSFLSALEAAPYAYSRQTGVYSGYTSDGRYVSGVTTSTTPNTTVQYLAQQQNTERIASFSAQMNDAYSRALWNLRRLSLKETVLQKGESIEGIVAIRLPSFYSLPNRFKFKLRVENNVFTHDFTISRKDS